jgi:hypothetical protein
MTFAADVRKFSERAQQATDRTVRAITFGLFREVIQRTPVDTGRLKGNWQASVGAPASGTLTMTDKGGSTTVVKMAAGIGGWGSTTYLTNNLPYAARIEYDGWSHTKAPAGMVRVSLARIQSIVRAAARENKA